jgi:hypothetical protein
MYNIKFFLCGRHMYFGRRLCCISSYILYAERSFFSFKNEMSNCMELSQLQYHHDCVLDRLYNGLIVCR